MGADMIEGQVGEAQAAEKSSSGGGSEAALPEGRHADKRERILRAAAELFASKDYHRVLMDEIADLADVGKGTLYRYFETKEDLFVAVLSYALDLATERLRAELHEMEDPVAQLEATCRQALRFFRRNGHLYRMLHHEKAFRCSSGRADIEEKINKLRHFVEHILQGGAQRGVFQVEDAGFASAMLWGMVRTALRSMPAEEPLDELSRRVAGLFTKGLLVRGPSGP